MPFSLIKKLYKKSNVGQLRAGFLHTVLKTLKWRILVHGFISLNLFVLHMVIK